MYRLWGGGGGGEVIITPTCRLCEEGVGGGEVRSGHHPSMSHDDPVVSSRGGGGERPRQDREEHRTPCVQNTAQETSDPSHERVVYPMNDISQQLKKYWTANGMTDNLNNHNPFVSHFFQAVWSQRR